MKIVWRCRVITVLMNVDMEYFNYLIINIRLLFIITLHKCIKTLVKV